MGLFPQVKEFVRVIEASHNLYGFREDTVQSLLLRLLPPPQLNIQTSQDNLPPNPLDTKVSILNTMLDNLRQIFGFYIPQVRNIGKYYCYARILYCDMLLLCASIQQSIHRKIFTQTECYVVSNTSVL